jgi:hypothetical protein
MVRQHLLDREFEFVDLERLAQQDVWARITSALEFQHFSKRLDGLWIIMRGENTRASQRVGQLARSVPLFQRTTRRIYRCFHQRRSRPVVTRRRNPVVCCCLPVGSCPPTGCFAQHRRQSRSQVWPGADFARMGKLVGVIPNATC